MDMEVFAREDPGREQAKEAISRYRDSLKNDEALDFALLDEEFRSRLLDNRLAAFFRHDQCSIGGRIPGYQLSTRADLLHHCPVYSGRDYGGGG